MFELSSSLQLSSGLLRIHLSCPRVLPHQTTRVSHRTLQGAVDVKAIRISGAGTAGGAADWVVNDIEVAGRSQLDYKDLPGALFGAKGVASRSGQTALSFKGLDIVEREQEFALLVTYVGSNTEGAPFFGCAIGERPPQRPTVIPITSAAEVLPCMSLYNRLGTDKAARRTITVSWQRAFSFQLNRLKISNAGTAVGPADWIVGDLRIAGQSCFKQPGDVPGDVFLTSMIDGFVEFKDCRTEGPIEIEIGYVGLNKKGCPFAACLEGTMVRDDYTVAPPDLEVLVETSGQGPGNVVVATCNWRSPASDNCPL
jgi:hypothetical protein